MASSIGSSVRYRRQAGGPPQRKTRLGFRASEAYSSLVPKALGPEFVSVLERKFQFGRFKVVRGMLGGAGRSISVTISLDHHRPLGCPPEGGRYAEAPGGYCDSGRASGKSKTSILPSGVRPRLGAYNPRSSRRHQSPDSRRSARLVNQYCQSSTRTCFGGCPANGLPAKSSSTSGSPASRRCSTFRTKVYCRQLPREANQRFQSNRG